jgi:NADH-quinone oxidoreductase subunit N
MPFEAPHVELTGIAPEIALSVAALVLLVLHAFVEDRWGELYLPALATVGLGVALFLALGSWGDPAELQLNGMIAADPFAAYVKVALAIFGIIGVWLGREYLRENLEQSEFYGLLLFAVAGMMLMASAANLIVIFLALEMFSFALYVLVAFNKRSLASQESAMKYFLLGAFSSAFLLLGIALAYGAVGSTALYDMGAGEDLQRGIVGFLSSTPAANHGLLIAASGFILVGLGFKIAAVPFHMWTPDAYQGAPTPVTGFMAAGTKLAAFAAMLRVMDAALFQLRADWRPIAIAIAVVTMVVGSILAVVQEDVKRLLAYSSIAHAGFILTGVIAANDDGVSGSLFYLAVYGATVLGAFAVVQVLGGPSERRSNLSDYRGLFHERPLIAAALALFMLSLAGVPLTSGFVGKLLVFGSVVEAGFSWVAVVGVIASVIAAFVYLRMLVIMFMEEPEEAAGFRETEVPVSGAVVIGFAALATVYLGILWGPLIDAAIKSTFVAAP